MLLHESDNVVRRRQYGWRLAGMGDWKQIKPPS